MKTLSIFHVSACILLAGGIVTSQAGTFSANFDDGQVPANAAIYGNAVVDSSGGYNDSGTLKLTKAQTSQNGSMIVNDLDFGAVVYGVQASFLARVGGGTTTPADGFSFCFASDLPDGTFSEEGAGSGLTVCFDTYVNTGAGETTPTIDLKFGGQLIATKAMNINDLLTGSEFAPVNVRLEADGSVDVDYKGMVIFTNVFLQNYEGIFGGRFGFGGRTGGLFANQFIDDISLETVLQPMPGIWRQPVNQTVLEGRAATFSAGVNNALLSTYQWLRNGQTIPGAIYNTYTIDPVTAADQDAKFSVRISIGQTSVTSDEVTLGVTRIDLPAAPVLSFDFNDGLVPPNTTVLGTAYIDLWSGINLSGALLLTLAANDQAGAFIIEDPHSGAPVYGFAANFQIMLGAGTPVPADGFSLNFATDLPDEATGMVEEGLGSGVSVTFDTYDNGGGEAPGIELRVNGVVVAEKKVPAGFLVNDAGYVDVTMRLASDGNFDLAWNGVVVFEQVFAEGFGSIAGGRFGFYARTGGLNANHWIDDLKLYTYLEPGALRITSQPSSQTVLVGRDATFTVEVNDPSVANYQWFRDDQAVAGAAQSVLELTGISAADDQAKFKVEVSGPGVNIISDEVTLSVLDLAPPASPQVDFDFNDAQLPVGTSIYGTAFVDAIGGVNDSGVMKLTLAENSQSGAFVIEALEGGAEINGFTAAFDMRAGGGTWPPADGFSFNFANDLPNTTIGEAENGAGTGITVAFDTYDNGGGEAPSIDLKYKGQVLVSKKVPLEFIDTGDNFVQVLIRVKQNGTFDMAYNGTVVYHNEPIPGFQPIAAGRFGFAARTGGLNANHFVDNVRIAVTKPAGPTRITQQPANALVLDGQQATFSVLVSDPQGVTYQWFRNGTAIAGATAASYTTEPLTTADRGAVITVVATGPGGPATSDPATITVITRFTAPATPNISNDFNDFMQPVGSVLLGSAYIDWFGGVNDSGVLKLTTAENDLMGSFLASTVEEEFVDFIATWMVRVGGGTETPADGMCFVVGSEIPEDSAFGEEGTGAELIISFDTYDNGGGEAPAIDVIYRGVVVTTRKLPISVLRTGDALVPVSVRVKRNQTLDLIYGDYPIFHNLALPNFEPFGAGCRPGFGARTGGLNDNHWVDDFKFAVNVEPPITEVTLVISRLIDGKLRVEWNGGGGVLQGSPTLPGTWTDIAGATSPYEFMPAADAQFFRVK